MSESLKKLKAERARLEQKIKRKVAEVNPKWPTDKFISAYTAINSLRQNLENTQYHIRNFGKPKAYLPETIKIVTNKQI